MNFFEHQERSKKNTTLLVVLFALAVIGIIMAVYAVIMGAIYTQTTESASGGISSIPWFDPNIFLLIPTINKINKLIVLKNDGLVLTLKPVVLMKPA